MYCIKGSFLLKNVIQNITLNSAQKYLYDLFQKKHCKEMYIFYTSDKPSNNSNEWCTCAAGWRWWRCSANASGQSPMCCLWYFCHLVSSYLNILIEHIKIVNKCEENFWSLFLFLCIQYKILFTKKNKSLSWKWEKFHFEMFSTL